LPLPPNNCPLPLYKNQCFFVRKGGAIILQILAHKILINIIKSEITIGENLSEEILSFLPNVKVKNCFAAAAYCFYSNFVRTMN